MTAQFERHSLTLGDADLLSEGGGRKIYRHPDSPDLIIKLHKPLTIKPLQGLRTFLRYYRRRFGPMMNSFVEIDEFAAMVGRTGEIPPFAAQFMGFVATNRGPGAMFEAIKTPGGKLAKSLKAHARRNPTEAAIETAIDTLWDDVVTFRAVVSDPSLRNVVVTGNADTGYRLILVDGLGERTLIPLLTRSAHLHRAYCDRARAKMKQEYRTQAQRP